MGKRPVILVDGANVAYAEMSQKGQPKVSNIVAVCDALRHEGFEPLVLVDASLMYEIDDPAQLDALIDGQTIRQVPAETDADYFILEMAEHEGAYVVSNDRFQAYEERYPWVEERRVPLMIIGGHVKLYGPAFEQAD